MSKILRNKTHNARSKRFKQYMIEKITYLKFMCKINYNGTH